MVGERGSSKHKVTGSTDPKKGGGDEQDGGDSGGKVSFQQYKLKNTALNFRGGKLRLFFEKWEELTSDETILGYVKGVSIPVDVDLNNLPLPRHELKFSEDEKYKTKKKIYEFLEKEIIEKVITTDEINSPSVISNFFLRPKSNGDSRFILNLKPFNELITKKKFKLSSLRQATKLITKDMYFTKLDFKDGYYSLPIDDQSKRFFRFLYEGELFQFCSLPQGYREAVRIFTKTLKPALAKLRAAGHILVNYIDDSLFMGFSYDDCDKAIKDALKLFDDLGYTINLEKSIVVPVKIIEFLGFVLDSENMWVKPTERRAEDLRNSCRNLLKNQSPTIRELAEVIGKLVAMTEGNKFGPLYTKRLEILKNKFLKENFGNFEGKAKLNSECIDDLNWWIANVDKFPKPIINPPYTSEMHTDASGMGFGIDCEGEKSNGLWNQNEKECHINFQELLAIKIGLDTNFKNKYNEHIHVYTDSSVAVSCISKMGSCKPKLNNVTREIWEFCMGRKNIITASHIPGVQNVSADKLSREHNIEIEWKLNPGVFENISKIFGPFDIDLFASRINFQIKPYASWKSDPDALFINAFNQNWEQFYSYCFPPFALIPQILQKLRQEKGDMCIIIPFWENQPFFSMIGSMLTEYPVLLSPKNYILLHPTDREVHHPLEKSLNLTACRLSGNNYKTRVFQERVRNFSWEYGDQGHKNNIFTTGKGGLNFVWRGISIPVLHM